MGALSTAFPTGLGLLNNGMMFGQNHNYYDVCGAMMIGANETWGPATVVRQGVPLPTGPSGYGTSHFGRYGNIAALKGSSNTLVVVAYSSGGYNVALGTATTDYTTDANGYKWTTKTHLYFKNSLLNSRDWPIEHVPLDGKDYFVMYDSIKGHKNNAELLFFDFDGFWNSGSGAVNATAGDGNYPNPTFSIDLNAAMDGGWGWNDAGTATTTVIADMAYDPVTKRLYVIENNLSGCRSGARTAPIHIFQLKAVPKFSLGTTIMVR